PAERRRLDLAGASPNVSAAMSLFLMGLVVLAAAWAHGAFRTVRRVPFKPALRLYLAGSLGTAAGLALASRGTLVAFRPLLLTLAALAGVVSRTGLVRLASFESRRRDTVWQSVCVASMALVFLRS